MRVCVCVCVCIGGGKRGDEPKGHEDAGAKDIRENIFLKIPLLLKKRYSYSHSPCSAGGGRV